MCPDGLLGNPGARRRARFAHIAHAAAGATSTQLARSGHSGWRDGPMSCHHLYGWLTDGWRSAVAAGEVEKSEKITINLGPVDLGQIDLLVAEGFYANRTDFIRSAIRAQIATRAAAVDQTVARRTLTLGTMTLTRHELEELAKAGRTVEIRVLGLATIAPDVSPELALATISAVEVLGAFRASPAVKAALAARTV
jgi:Arc/MetJ-type ribon-helix-helix transcriptional regulator